MNRKSVSVMIGIVIILIGTVILGNNLSWWNVDIFFPGWWTLFIIIPSIIGMVKDQTYFSSSIFIVLGILLFLACQEIIIWDLVWKILLPIVFITLGLSIIFKPSVNKMQGKKIGKAKQEYIGIFSGSEDKVKGKFEDATCTAVFGGVELDLRDASIKEDIVIDCISVFGGITIKVPDNVIVKPIGTPIFGGVENRAIQNKDSKITIHVNYTCIFGGIEIR